MFLVGSISSAKAGIREFLFPLRTLARNQEFLPDQPLIYNYPLEGLHSNFYQIIIGFWCLIIFMFPNNLANRNLAREDTGKIGKGGPSLSQ